MQLRGIEFGKAVGAPGRSGIFAKPRWYEDFLRFFPGYSNRRTIPITHAVTKDGVQGRKKTKAAYLGAGAMLSTDIFPGSGLKELLSYSTKPESGGPSFLVLASRKETLEERLSDFKEMAENLRGTLPSSVALVLDFSPRTDADDLVEMQETVEAMATLPVPIVAQVSLMFPPDVGAELLRTTSCDAILVSSSLPWKYFPEKARKVFFRTDSVPFGTEDTTLVSGKYMLPLAIEWVRQAKKHGVSKPLIAGGAVYRKRDVDELAEAGVSAVFLGREMMLRLWNLRSILSRIYAVIR